jgi:hypothetical protein
MMAIFSPENLGTVFSLALIPNITRTTQNKIFNLALTSKNKTFHRMVIGLRDALRGKGNFGLGKATRKEAIEMGNARLGKGYRVSSKNSNVWISKDGLRQFRGPSPKKIGRVQANFQRRKIPSGTFEKYNGHLDITN